MTTLLLILLLTATLKATHSQIMEIQDLTENEGYIPIKEDNINIIDHYNRIFHFVNLTNYYNTLENINKNIKLLDSPISDLQPLIDTKKNNFKSLKRKLDNLTPHFRSRRGLIDGLGKGIKFITGNMDSEDEAEIRAALSNLTKITDKNIFEINNIIQVSKTLSSQIQNITEHINKQQYIVGKYINKFKYEVQNRISTLEDEVSFMKHLYQIDSDINLLKNHIDDIGRVIFTSKLGIIPTDLLNDEEIKVVNNFETYTRTKVAISSQDNQIIIILSIPLFTNSSFSQIILEPIPNKFNKSLYLPKNRILIDQNKHIFYPNVSQLYRDLELVNDKCINNIVKNKEASCALVQNNATEIKEIRPGLILFKNFFQTFSNDCNNRKQYSNNMYTFIINFENCKIYVGNKTFYNSKFTFKEKFIQTHLLTKIKENKTFVDLNLNDLYIKQLQYEENFKDLTNNHNLNKTINITTNGTIILILLVITITVSILRKRKVRILEISSEPQSNGGGVTITPNRILI